MAPCLSVAIRKNNLAYQRQEARKLKKAPVYPGALYLKPMKVMFLI